MEKDSAEEGHDRTGAAIQDPEQFSCLAVEVELEREVMDVFEKVNCEGTVTVLLDGDPAPCTRGVDEAGTALKVADENVQQNRSRIELGFNYYKEEEVKSAKKALFKDKYIIRSIQKNGSQNTYHLARPSCQGSKLSRWEPDR